MAFIRRALFPAMVAVAAYYAIFGGEYSALDVHRIRAEAGDARILLHDLQASTGALAARAEALEHDPMTLETLARESFGMIREGEVLYRFADSGEEEGEGEGSVR